MLTAPVAWRESGNARSGVFMATDQPALVALHEEGAAPDQGAVDATIARWQQRAPDTSRLQLAVVARDEDERAVRDSLSLSACVLLGLHFDGGGIVAAPTTSLPQWPGTQRTWDYRYCWMRDASLAATAMLRCGLVDEAGSLGEFLGEVLQREEPPALVRVDGTEPPEEQELHDLTGYRGARPVRIGNAAAKQLQVDIAGEVTQLARALAGHEALPDTLARACTRIADWAATRWQDPDHGIWEIRGAPRRYTYSQVMAWTALRDAAVLADSGRISGHPAAWLHVADEVRAHVLRRGDSPLQLTDSADGPDAAIACAPLVGLLDHDSETARSTLDLIERGLDRNGLLDRCLAEHEAFPDPCGPFLFPTFWMASAQELCGGDGRHHFHNAYTCRGSTGLFGEVADPQTLSPLGNYPQVQSHAAFLLAATDEARS